MPDITAAGVHINQVMTNLSLGYHPKGMIAERVIAVVPVKNESDFYYIWNKGDALRRVDTRRGDGDEANTVDFGFTKDSYLCEEYALQTKITDRQRRNADNVLSIQLAKTRRVQDLVLMDQEGRVATLFTTTGNYASTNRVTLSGTGQWNNAAFTGSIEQTIDDAKEAVRINTAGNIAPEIAIIPVAVAKVIKRDAKVRDLIKWTQSDLLVNGELPPRLWNLEIVSPFATEATSNEVYGADAPTLTDMWGKNVILTARPSAPSIDTLAHAYIFRNQDWRVTQWRNDSRDTDFYRVSLIQTEKVVCNVGGYLISACIS